jgi:hypothetical protein
MNENSSGPLVLAEQYDDWAQPRGENLSASKDRALVAFTRSVPQYAFCCGCGASSEGDGKKVAARQSLVMINVVSEES